MSRIGYRPDSKKKHSSRVFIAFFSVFCLVFGLTASTALADGHAPTLVVTLAQNKDTVLTNESVTYTVAFSCASNDTNCENSTVTLDIPRFSFPNGEKGTAWNTLATITSATNSSGVAVKPTISNSTVNAEGKVTYKLGTVPAGSTGQMNITVKFPRFFVPKDATLTPGATYAATGATEKTASITTTVDGNSDLKIFKWGPPLSPPKDTEVTYDVFASFAASVHPDGRWKTWPGSGHVNAENIVVMAATRVYSTAAYVVASLVAICFGLSPKFGAVISATPGAVLGGICVVLYGMIGLLGAKIWKENHVDFGNPINLIPAAAGIIIGIGDVKLPITEGFTLGGIALGTIVTVAVYHIAHAIAPRELREAADGASLIYDAPGIYSDDMSDAATVDNRPADQR